LAAKNEAHKDPYRFDHYSGTVLRGWIRTGLGGVAKRGDSSVFGDADESVALSVKRSTT
jgi:hypothetical protein